MNYLETKCMKERLELLPHEIQRYSRHLVLPGFGMENQKKLKNASVLVIGAGGLGAPLLLYLAAAGVGKIGIVDPDRVDESNLQRQVLYTMEDIGYLKVDAARRRLLAMNPLVEVETFPYALTNENALQILGNYDVVADGTDNFPTRYLVNDACVILGKVNVYASIFRFEGQVSVFNYTLPGGERGPNYRNLYPTPPAAGSIPSCAEGGVLGVLPGIIGSIQANEVIKIITGIGAPLAGRLFLFDAAAFTTRVIRIPAQAPVVVDALIDYEVFCDPFAATTIPEIGPNTLKSWIAEGKAFQLIDVREPAEFAIGNIGGELIPLASISEDLGRIRQDQPVVFVCHSGQRSAIALQKIQGLTGWTHLFNLKGGIKDWPEATTGYTL